MAGRITSMSKIKQVLIMQKQGMSNRDIAKEMGLNKSTVNNYYMHKVRLDTFMVFFPDCNTEDVRFCLN